MPVTKKRNHFLFPGLQATTACDHVGAEAHVPIFGRAGVQAGGQTGIDAVFVNVPYCRVKCHECPFFSSYLPNATVRAAEFIAYFDAVARQLEAAMTAAASPVPPASARGATEAESSGKRVGRGVPLYFGGGTPTIVGAHHVAATLGRVREAGIDLSEITVEGNPEDVSYPHVEAMAEMGVTRMSLGVQSTNPRLLHLVGSPHNREDIDVALAAIRAHKMAHNVDLLYGLPAQNLADVDHQLSWVMGVRPTSVTWYPYAISPEGVIRLQRGRQPPLTGDLGRDETPEATHRVYLHIREFMLAAG